MTMHGRRKPAVHRRQAIQADSYARAMGRQLSLHVVGAAYPNKRGGGDRRFEILLCVPGEPVTLVLEPNNPADPNAIAVHSVRGIQIGYLVADRAAWFGGMMRQGVEVTAIFQEATKVGAAIRVGLDGEVPVLPPIKRVAAPPAPDDFWPDYLPPDD